MRIGITTFGSDGGRSGIGRYIVQLLHSMARLADDDELEVMVLEQDRDVFKADYPNVRQICLPERLRKPVASIAWHQVALAGWCRRRRYDAILLASANRRLPAYVPCPAVGTVHDLAGLHVADKYDGLHQFYLRRVVPFLISRLDHVIAVSACTKRDIVTRVGLPDNRVTVVPNGVDGAVFSPLPRSEAAARVTSRYGIPTPFVLYVSRLEHPGKNHVRLIEAFSRLKNATDLPHHLVLAGPPCERADAIHAAAAASPHRQDIHFLGFVDSQDLPALYSCAELSVFPSLFEGFGLPVLEAMACGAPVACSNTSSLPEVAGDAALMFDPLNVEAMQEAMRLLLQDPGARERAIGRGLAWSRTFSWERSARSTLDVLHAAAGRVAA